MGRCMIEWTPEERAEILRVRFSSMIRCSLRLPLVRPCEFTGCLRLWRKGGTFSYNRFSLPWLTRVSTIYIRRPEFGDSDAATLQHFSGIVAADFGDTALTDCGITSLFSSKETLTYLFLWGTKVGEGIVPFVEKVPALKMLNISTQFIGRSTFTSVCDRLPECYVAHDRFGQAYRGLTGDDATNAWLTDLT